MKQDQSATRSGEFPRQEIAVVEKCIRQHDGEFTQVELWEQVSKEMARATFEYVIDFMLFRRKISADANGKLHWILPAVPKDRYSVREEANAITCHMPFGTGFLRSCMQESTRSFWMTRRFHE